MTRYFVVFAYDGTNYHGWQIQPNGNSVQEELQKALSILLRENIEVVGAGQHILKPNALLIAPNLHINLAAYCLAIYQFTMYILLHQTCTRALVQRSVHIIIMCTHARTHSCVIIHASCIMILIMIL